MERTFERKPKLGVAIAVDFDGTITESNDYPRIGKIRPYAAKVINAMQDRGYFVYLWTCRNGKTLHEAIDFLHENGIYMDAYNDGPSTGSRKLVANVYIDDAAYPNNGDIDWLEIADMFRISV